MRYFAFAALCFFSSCTTVDTDRTTLSVPTAVRTQITFEPFDREKAVRYLQTERFLFKKNTDPMIERAEGLKLGRKERYDEIGREFPECDRQRHCESHLSRGGTKRFERYNELSKEILAYDKQIIELEAAVEEWKRRLEIRSRAILNRFLVHEVLQIPKNENHFQSILVHSLESFDTRRQISYHLLRYSGDSVIPSVVGDLDFRMLGRPVDEGAVVATFDVYLSGHYNEPKSPTRYVVTMLINTHQLDMRYYDKDFMRAWSKKLAEPFQEELRSQVFCGIYSIGGYTLLPKLDANRSKRCGDMRSEMQTLEASKFEDRFPPDRWILPIAYYPLARPLQNQHY